MKRILGKWYNLAENQDIEVVWDTTEEYTIENELKKGQIKVMKPKHVKELMGYLAKIRREKG